MITVFTQPACTRCPGVIRYLQSKVGADHVRIIDVTESEEALAHVKALGHASTPVVETPKGSYAGNNQKEIAALL